LQLACLASRLLQVLAALRHQETNQHSLLLLLLLLLLLAVLQGCQAFLQLATQLLLLQRPPAFRVLLQVLLLVCGA
jgi:hypothetical protein